MSEKRLRYPVHWKKKKEEGKPITVITAYDAAFAKLISRTPLDAILVGDTLGMVVQGEKSTHPVTVEDIIYHTKMVRRGAPETFIISDMPFGSYQTSVEDGVRNAFRIMKESGATAVKLEGATPHTLEIIKRLVSAGIPVMGHVGLTPQSFLNTGGFRVQGKTDESSSRIMEDSRMLEDAGCFSIVLELTPTALSQQITEALSIPTIGIGAGPKCSGQVMVLYDMLGMDPDFLPRHAKRYANFAADIHSALTLYHNEVTEGSFPDEDHSFF